MKQKLSAMKYIKNNKRRVSVLVVSLCLCFVLTYLTIFLLSSTEETFYPILVENTKKIQYIRLAGSSLGVDVNNSNMEELYAEYDDKNIELAEKLKLHEGVNGAYYTQIIYNQIDAPVGTMTVEIPLADKETAAAIVKHYGTEISEGKMPENPGEIVLDEASMKRGNYQLGGYFKEDNFGKTFKIVGILACDTFFGCGIPSDEYEASSMIVVLSDGSIEDMTTILKEEGITVRDTYDTVLDAKWGKEFLQEEVIDVISISTDIGYACILALLSIALFIVYTMYLRDRHNEWCLYCSIGYSRKEIYHSIMRELLFTFGAALLFGVVLISISVVAVDYIMIKPVGIRCRYFYPETLVQILCSYVLLIGILQIPIRYALYKIRTIDAMDDDLY